MALLSRAAVMAILAASATVMPASAQPYAYVLGQTDDPAPGNSGPQFVTVIDTATNTKVARIPAGLNCRCVGPNAMAMSPDGAILYVGNSVSDAVTAIATATNQVVDTLPASVVGSGPVALRVSPDNTRLYVLGATGDVVAVDRASRTRVGATVLNAPQTRGMAVTPDGARLYISTYGSASVKIVDTVTMTVTGTIPVAGGSLPLAVEVTPDGAYVLVATPFADTITVISTATNSVVTAIPVGARPYAVGVLPNGTRAYAPNNNGASVSRIELATLTVNGTIANVSGAWSIAFTADSAKGYVATTDGVRPIVIATNTAGTLIPMNVATEGQPAAIVATPPPFTPPGSRSPSGLTAQVAGNRVTLTWNAPTAGGAPTGYIVEGGLVSGQVLASVATGSAAPAFAFDAPDGTFYLRVHAQTAAGRSAASNEILLAVNVPQPPSAPTNLLGLVVGDTLALAWKNTTSGGRQTDIVLDVSGGVTGSASVGLAESFTFPGVPPGTYTFRLRAVNALGSSAASAPVTLTFPATCSGVPQTPANPSLSKAGSVVTFAWDPPAAGAAPTSYLVTATGAVNGSAPTTARTLSGAVGPGTYTLTVRAVNACGESGDTTPQTITVP